MANDYPYAIKNVYQGFLQVFNGGAGGPGITGSLQQVSSGDGTTCPLYLSATQVKIGDLVMPVADGSAGYALKTDGSGNLYFGSVAAGSVTLSSLNDVSLSSPSSGQFLEYNGSKWINHTLVTSDISDIASASLTFTNKAGNISQWTNDSGYVTASSSTAFTNKSGNISQWTNDSGYITSSGSISGNAATATALQNARTIGNVSFDGTANIVPQTTQIASDTTNATYYITYVSATSGALQEKANSGATINPSTNTITATTFIGNLTGTASNVTTNANLTGEVTSSGNAATLDKTAITNRTADASPDVAADYILTYDASATAIKKALLSNVTVGSATSATTASTVTTNANLTGEVTSSGNAATLDKTAITNRTADASPDVAADYILTYDASATAIKKALLSNVTVGTATTATTASTVTTNANLTGPITSVGNATSVASQTGTGSKFVMDTSPVLVTPTIGVATATTVNKVTITQPATGSTLTIDNGFTLHASANATVSGTNTGDQNEFSNIAVSGQTTVTPASTSDTLTLVAGTNVTITTDNTAKSVTINSAGGGGGSNATTATVTDVTTNSSFYPIFVPTHGGSTQALDTSTGFSINPSTNTVTATTFNGALTGNVTGNCSGSSGSCTGNAATVTTNANLTGPITSVGNATSVAAQTGTGSVFMMQASPTVTGLLTVPNAGLAITDTTGNFTTTLINGTSLTGNRNLTITPGDLNQNVSFLGSDSVFYDCMVAGINTGDQTSVTGNAGTVTVAVNNTNAAYYPTFVTATSGSLSPQTDATLTYNPNTHTLTTTTFVGALTGNASGSSGSCTGNAATATALQTARAIGGVSFDGSAAITPNNITAANDTTNATYYLPYFSAQTGAVQPKTNAGLSVNPSTNNVTATTFTGALSGNATTATTLQTARAIGGVNFDGSGAITPQNIQIATDTTNATYYLTYVSATSGNLQEKVNSGTSINPSTNTLTTSTVVANLTGNVTGNCTGSSGSCTGNSATVTTNANLTGPITSVGNATSVASQTGTGTKFVMDTNPTFSGSITVPASGLQIVDQSGSFYTVEKNGAALTANRTFTQITADMDQTLDIRGSNAVLYDGMFAGLNTGDQVLTGSTTNTAYPVSFGAVNTTPLYVDSNASNKLTYNPSTQTLNAANLTLANALPVTQGGTGVGTMTTAYAPVCAGTTATGNLQVASTGLSTAGWVLTSNGASALPSFQAPTGGTGTSLGLLVAMTSRQFCA